MGEYFRKVWEIEIEKIHLALDYWYISVSILVIATILIWYAVNKSYKKK